MKIQLYQCTLLILIILIMVVIFKIFNNEYFVGKSDKDMLLNDAKLNERLSRMDSNILDLETKLKNYRPPNKNIPVQIIKKPYVSDKKHYY